MKRVLAFLISATITPAFANSDFVPQPNQIVFTINNEICSATIEDCSTGFHYFINDAEAARSLILQKRVFLAKGDMKLEAAATVAFNGVNFTRARIWGTDTYLWFLTLGLAASEVDLSVDDLKSGGWTFTTNWAVSERLDYVVEQRKYEADLNNKYKQVIARLSPTQRAKLRNEERVWLVERDKLKGDQKAFLESTKQRIQFLASSYP
jgi:hypothetical protein